jgi:hypothetical protein
MPTSSCCHPHPINNRNRIIIIRNELLLNNRVGWNGIEEAMATTYEVVDVREGEGAVPGEGVEVRGDDAEEALGMGVEENGAAWLLQLLMRLGLAEDGRHLHRLRRRHRATYPVLTKAQVRT